MNPVREAVEASGLAPSRPELSLVASARRSWQARAPNAPICRDPLVQAMVTSRVFRRDNSSRGGHHPPAVLSSCKCVARSRKRPRPRCRRCERHGRGQEATLLTRIINIRAPDRHDRPIPTRDDLATQPDHAPGPRSRGYGRARGAFVAGTAAPGRATQITEFDHHRSISAQAASRSQFPAPVRRQPGS